VDSYKSTNIWNSPLEITYTYKGTTYKSYLGNYWDDYGGTDAEGDGIGDTHYSIYSESDDYPLMKPFENYILPRSASI
jgi:nitrous oxidase accessory protein NosD